MDSPETSTKLTTASDSPPVQDSPFFNYISNLSPIAITRSSHVTRELSRLNSPPIVFKSPRKKEHSETNVLKRSCSLQLSGPQASRSVNRGGECVGAPVDNAERSVTQNELIAEKGCDVAGSAETQPSSSSGCVDEFLADLGEGDCVSSAKLVTPNSKHSNDSTTSYRSGSKDLKETALTFDDKNGMWINGDGNLVEPFVLLEDAEEDIHRESESGVKSFEIAKEPRDAYWPSHRFPNFKTSSHVDHAHKKQSRQNSHAQVIEHEHHIDLEHVSQPSPEPFPVQTNKDHSEAVGGVSERLVGNANAKHRGVRRRCLQFEQVHLSTVRCNVLPSNIENTVNSAKRSTSTVDLETFKSSNVETKEIQTSERLIVNLPQSTPTLSCARSSENISMASKPLGIGLHLNSIVNATSLGCAVTASKKTTDHDMGIGGILSGSLESTQSCSTSFSVTEKDSATNEERVCPSKALVVASSATNQFPHAGEDPGLTQEENENSNCQNVEGFEENDQTSLQKKRKKATSSVGGDGCKHCNCKKTKCLKLYCDCFAAGVYCSDPCSCQGCFNKPEHKDKVLETREQIESRNPLAFAPRIVQRISDLPPNNGEDGNRATPSSARHKRGCNCKRSMCLKKYCECYQSNVGCSSGCRCEGCKNVYGRKEEYVAIEHVVTREIMGEITCKEQLDRTFDKDSAMVEFTGDLLCAELINSHNLTPVTPSFQHSDNAKDAPKSKSGSISSKSNVVANAHHSKFSDPPAPMLSSTSLKRDSLNLSGHDRLLSRSLTRPGSPLTPMTRFGGTKPSQVPDSGCELANILETDETPVKVSSPNKKRVSPPQSRIYKLGSGSSGGIRSGRKFILKSMPSFPPLTPCIDSKGSSISQNTQKLQDKNSIKK